MPINSLEGYIRQIIGWREFMRGIYQNYDQRLDKTNFFNHKRKMKKSWYDGNTGLDPLDHAINNAKNLWLVTSYRKANDISKHYESV